MTEKLSAELHRIGDTVAPAYVPQDTWARGRRARRRDHLVSAAAVLVLIAIVGGLAGLVRTEGPQPAAPVTDGAVPSTIHGMPGRLVTESSADTMEVAWDDRIVETDLDIGRASVAFLGGYRGELPVVITADDGAYHPLSLPGWIGAGRINSSWFGEGLPLALAPDGRSLAYAWWDPTAPLDRPMPAGVRVLDLETGDLRTISLYGGNGVRVETIVWSPDSRWLAWRGRETKSWTPMSSGGGRPVAGRIAPDARTSEALPQYNASYVALAVAPDGRVNMTRQGGLTVLWNGEVLARSHGAGRNVTSSAAFSPDGDRVSIGTFDPRFAASFVDPATGRITDRRLPTDLGPDGVTVRPLGWVDDDTVAAIVLPRDGNWVLNDVARIALFTAPSAAEPTFQLATRFADGVDPTMVTVAVDLIDLDHSTTDFPEPDWPWSDERKWAVGLLTAAAVGVLGLMLVRASMRRRVSTGSTGRLLR